MATRSLLEIFIIMRNNALQNRHMYSDRNDYNDRSSLMSRDEHIVPMRDIPLSSDWSDAVEEIQYEISRIKSKNIPLAVKGLFALHNKHLTRPSFDDNIREVNEIEVSTQEVTQIMSRCRRLIQQINAHGKNKSTDKKLSSNIVSSLARTIQDLSSEFRTGQSDYLKKIQKRDQCTDVFSIDDKLSLHEQEADALFHRGFTDHQQLQIEQNQAEIQQRSEETMQICRSIEELNEIFRDLASFVTDQGTVLDRIDYHLEQTHNQVESGLKQLQKASSYQKKNRKMQIILLLAAIVTFLTFLLILIKN